MRLAIDREPMPMHVGRAPEPMRDHARRRRLVGGAIDQDEAAGVAIVGIGVEGDGHGGRDIAEADFVEIELFRRQLVEIVDVETVLELGDRSRRRPAADLEQIGAAGQHRLGAHPQEMRRELIGDLRAAVRARQHVAARDVDLVGQRQRDGVAGLGGLDLAVGDQEARDRALTARIGGDDAIASARSARSGSCRRSRENPGADG